MHRIPQFGLGTGPGLGLDHTIGATLEAHEAQGEIREIVFSLNRDFWKVPIHCYATRLSSRWTNRDA